MNRNQVVKPGFAQSNKVNIRNLASAASRNTRGCEKPVRFDWHSQKESHGNQSRLVDITAPSAPMPIAHCHEKEAVSTRLQHWLIAAV
jgi:hypothetical protein